MTNRFLMLTTRSDEVISQSERQALLTFTGLEPAELVNLRLEAGEFPDIDLDQWDGIIMCGSSYDVSMPEEDKSERQKYVERNLEELLDRVIERDFPLLGICYGLGLAARHLGGKVGYEISEDITAPVLTKTEEGKQDPLLGGIPDSFHAYLGHHESVIQKPEGMTTLVTGPIAPVQMARVGKNTYLTQFHPELDYDGIMLRIDLFSDLGYYPLEERAAVEERVTGVDVSPAHLILSNFVNIYGKEEE